MNSDEYKFGFIQRYLEHLDYATQMMQEHEISMTGKIIIGIEFFHLTIRNFSFKVLLYFFQSFDLTVISITR